MKKIFFFILIAIFYIPFSFSQETNDICLECHSDNELTTEKNGKTISLFVHQEKYLKSVHSELECISCHEDADPEDLPHPETLVKVNCSNCHDTEVYETSIHSQKKINCSDCHSKHNIQPADSLKQSHTDFCLACHKTASVKNYKKSIHYRKLKEGENSPECLDCHSSSAHSIMKDELKGSKVNSVCANCHEQSVSNFILSLHGEAVAKGKRLAPNCSTCHNAHNIKSSKDKTSKTYIMNIPGLCGDCHKEGTKVSQLKSISQRNVLEDYAESIHGEGLLKRGLIVTAVCTSCHFSHNILRHQDPSSSINRNNVAKTCMQCHVRIEEVHKQVIDGELWEKEPHKIPVCVDCHQSHKVRNVYYEDTMADKICMECHKNPNLSMKKDGKIVSLFVNKDHLVNSAHKESSCIKCHTDVTTKNNPICKNSGKVDCSICHANVVNDYKISAHGRVDPERKLQVPYCTDCHETHNIKYKTDVTSPTFKRNVPATCAACHSKSEIVTEKSKIFEKDYSESVHGKGLVEKGLIVTATCVDCHSAHKELSADDLNSTIHPNNAPETCAKCHLGVYEQFKNSIHSPTVTKTDKKLPVCDDCHSSHTIGRVDKSDFRNEILKQCGSCHEEVTETYFDTFHGKVSELGSSTTAKCHDCHGAHNILPVSNPNSTLSRRRIVQTCKSCHPNSNRKFVGYLTHATHHDKDKYPILFYTFWAMTILLVSTFTFFGIHTLLWMPRALAEKKRFKKMQKEQQENNNE